MNALLSSTAARATHRAARLCLTAAVAMVALAGCGDADRADQPSTAAEPTSENLDFERGDFSGWRTLAFESGAWHVYAHGTSPPDPDDTNDHVVFDVPAPPQGDFAAVTDMRFQGARILHRKLRIEGASTLRMTLFYESAGGAFSSPASLDYYTGAPNKQFRVELLDPDVPVTSMKPGDRLATIFRTMPGDPASLRPRAVTFDLSPWAGQIVRLRFAQVDNRGPLRAGVDDVRVETIQRVERVDRGT